MCTIFTLIGLEVFQHIFQRFHARNTQLVFTTRHHSDLVKITDLLNEHGCKVINCSVTSCVDKHDKIRVKMLLLAHTRGDETEILKILKDFRSISVEKIE